MGVSIGVLVGVAVQFFGHVVFQAPVHVHVERLDKPRLKTFEQLVAPAKPRPRPPLPGSLPLKIVLLTGVEMHRVDEAEFPVDPASLGLVEKRIVEIKMHPSQPAKGPVDLIVVPLRIRPAEGLEQLGARKKKIFGDSNRATLVRRRSPT